MALTIIENDLAPKAENSGTPGKLPEAPAPVAGEQKMQCPRCGWHETGNPRAPEADLKEYLRSIMGGRRFTKTYPLYDGAMQFSFRTLASYEADRANDVIMRNAFDSSDELADVGRKTKILFFMTRVSNNGKVTEYQPPQAVVPPQKDNEPPGDPVFDYSKAAMLKEYNKRFAEFDETMIRQMFRTLSLFEALQRLLISDGFDDAFWKGAGPF